MIGLAILSALLAVVDVSEGVCCPRMEVTADTLSNLADSAFCRLIKEEITILRHPDTGICADGSYLVGPYCGTCNMFGCDCVGGCVVASAEQSDGCSEFVRKHKQKAIELYERCLQMSGLVWNWITGSPDDIEFKFSCPMTLERAVYKIKFRV